MTTLRPIKPGKNHHKRAITDIPVEIFSKIFIQCLGVGHKISEGSDWCGSQANPTGFNSGEAPLLLTKVCRLWRTISLSTQHLWTVLPRLGMVRILPESGKDRLFRMYLTHSGSAPLSIRILVQTPEWSDYTAALLSPHIHRAGQLRVAYTQIFDDLPSRSIDRLFADHRGMFKLLTHLQITSCEFIPMPELSPLNAFEDVPLLKSVSLYCISRKVNLPLSQIKHYHHHVHDIGETSDILLPCTQLETLNLCTKSMYRSSRGGTQASIYLPRLRKMRLTDENGTNHRLLDSLRAPLLEVIQIDDLTRTSPVPSALISCIVRSHSTALTSLQLLCMHVGVDELLQLSRLAPVLRELDALLTSDALRALMFSHTGNNIFPGLTRLTVHEVPVHIRELIDICQSRFSPNLAGVEGEPQVEPLKYCKIYPDVELGSREIAWQMQDVAESFQNDANFEGVIDKLEQVLKSASRRNTAFNGPQAPLEDLHDLEDCFDFLDTYEITHPLLLKRHNVVMIMDRLSQDSPETIATPPHIQMRASALLAKWGPLVREYNVKHARWHVRGGGGRWHTLVYCPNSGGRFQSKFIY